MANLETWTDQALKEHCADLGAGLPDKAPAIVIANMVMTIDGRASIEGLSGGLSSPGDKQLFFHLRQLADVIVVGAGTARSEGYRLPKKPNQPLVCVSRSGDAVEGAISIPSPTAALEFAQEQCGAVPIVLCEGGPSLLSEMIAKRQIDELFLTVAPRLGGDTRWITKGGFAPTSAELVSQVQVGNDEFRRYRIENRVRP